MDFKTHIQLWFVETFLNKESTLFQNLQQKI
jgi:hypothetical protein